jgi:hypothetical protein
MSNAFLDYSSWSFQLIAVLGFLYLIVGLAKPSWVLASRRSTVAAIGIVVLLLASTAFYAAMQPLENAAVEAPSALNTPAGAPAAPQQ